MEAGRISMFLDGAVPGAPTSMLVEEMEDTSYLQPDMEVIEISEGKQPAATKLCQRLQEQPISIIQWIRDNQNTLIIAGGLYISYRLLWR